MRFKHLLPVLVFACASRAAADEWSYFPESNFILDVAVDSAGVWAATPGGVTRFRADGTFERQLTALDGLPNTMTQAIALDGYGDLWIGTIGDAALRIRAGDGEGWYYRGEDGLFGGTVTAVAPVSDGVWVATTGGASKFLGEEREAEGRSRYNELYGLLADSVLAVAEYGGSVWFGTSRGISRLDAALVFTAPPMNPASRRVNAFAVRHDTLWAAADNGPQRLEGSSFFRRNVGLPGGGGNVRDLVVANDTLWATTGNSGGAFFWNGASWTARNSGLFDPGTVGGWASGRALGFHPSGGLWTGTDRGLARRVGDVWERVSSEGPPSNFLVSIAEDADGGIWVAAGADANLFQYGTEPWAGARGAGRLLDGDWTTFDHTNSGLTNDNCYRVARGAGDEVYVGTWGFGLFRYRPAAAAWDTLQPMPPLDSTLVDVVADLAVSTDGTLWAAGYTKGLGALTPGGEWFPYLPGDGIPNPEAFQYPRALAARGGTLWMGTYGAEVAGLAIARLETRGTYDDKDDDYLPPPFEPSSGWTNVEGTVFDVLLEPDGTLWAATATGVARYDASGWDTFANGAIGHPLGQVRGIARDAGGNLWFATGSGLAMRAAAGGAWTHYDVETSDIPGDDVTAVLVESATGDVWVTVWGSGAARLHLGGGGSGGTEVPAKRIAASPNPFRPGSGGLVTFPEIEAGSVVRIYALGGTLVRELPAGSDLEWDGRDASGRLVASGVYVVTAEGPRGSARRGSLAVVR